MPPARASAKFSSECESFMKYVWVFALAVSTMEPKAHRWQSFFSTNLCEPESVLVLGRLPGDASTFPGPLERALNVDWDLASTDPKITFMSPLAHVEAGGAIKKVVRRTVKEGQRAARPRRRWWQASASDAKSHWTRIRTAIMQIFFPSLQLPYRRCVTSPAKRISWFSDANKSRFHS